MAFRMLSLAAFIFALLLAPVIEASEMDSFTRRKELFSLYEPANPALDAIVNGFMADAASRVNMHLNKSGSSTIDCTNTYKKMEDTLYDLVGHWYILGVNTMISNMERQLNPGKSRYYLNATTGDNIPIPIMKNDRSKGHVYKELSWRNYPIVHLFQGAVLRYKTRDGEDILLGTDKFGHYMQTGMEVYRKRRLHLQEVVNANNMTLEQAWSESEMWSLQENVRAERGKYGLGEGPGVGSGLFSYADMCANYEGMKLWSQMTVNSSMPAFQVEDPFLLCTPEKGWHRSQREFTFQNAIHVGWDEAINPNKYRTPEAEGQVLEAIKKLKEQGKLDSDTLPIDMAACAKLMEIYPQDFLPYLVSPTCLETAPKTTQQ